MTRFVKAWKSWAAATAILWMAARQARFGSQRRDSEEARFSAIRSALRLIWAVGASVLVLACVPSTAFAGQRSSLHAHLGTTKIGNKPAHHSNGTTVHSRVARVDPPHCGRAGRAIHVNGELLAPGSGYGTPGGSCSVRALQRRLAATGYAPGPIDGLYGPLTERAVGRYQGAYGLLVDGIAGSRTLGSIVARTRVINPGAGYVVDGSSPVRALQRRLARAGFHPGPIDGLYGPLTDQAVRRFQSAHGLSVDGVAGPQTLTHLSDQAASRPRPSQHAPRKPTRTAPASRKTGHTRPTPATRTPAGVAKPGAQRRPSHGPGFGTILLICLGIAGVGGA
jgi:peptidoglycan hydrolase-like protein with peptidoglycan-binding domain